MKMLNWNIRIRKESKAKTFFFAMVACMFVAAAAQKSVIASSEDVQRDLTVQQNAVFSIVAPKPEDGLKVTAWADREDNTYAVGESIRLYVRTNKDAYVNVINVGPTGNTTVLFPNAFQKKSKHTQHLSLIHI